MNARIRVLAFALALSALALTAMSPPERKATQTRESADLVVVGKVHDLSYSWHRYDGDGVCVRWLAEVVVTAVERGRGALIGEKLNIRWTEDVRKPGRPAADQFAIVCERVSIPDIPPDGRSGDDDSAVKNDRVEKHPIS